MEHTSQFHHYEYHVNPYVKTLYILTEEKKALSIARPITHPNVKP